MIIETPSLVGRGVWPLSISILRIRAHAKVESAAIHLSDDDVTYHPISRTRLAHFGGPLLDPLTATGPSQVEQGPRFTPMGPDIALVQDYSADESSWRVGRQVAVLVNRVTNEAEICFLRNITVLSGTEVRLDGLLRNRYDTDKLAFPIDDTWVYITSPARTKTVRDPMIMPGATIYVKVLPSARSSMAISEVSAQELLIRGKGVVPMNTSKPWITPTNNPHILTGQNVPLRVMYRSNLSIGTGSGAQNFGFLHGNAPVDGLLVWRFRETDDTLIKEVSTAEPSLDVSNADLVEWFGSEPAEFDVGVVNAKGGYYSDEQKTRITVI